MCWSKRRTPGMITACGSSLVALMAIVVLSMTVYYWTTDQVINVEDPVIEDFSISALAAILIGAMIAGILGCIGMCCYNIGLKRIIYPITYGTFLMPTWIILLVVGAVLTLVGNQLPHHVEQSCQGE